MHTSNKNAVNLRCFVHQHFDQKDPVIIENLYNDLVDLLQYTKHGSAEQLLIDAEIAFLMVVYFDLTGLNLDE